jgi:hypothetical protein
LKPTSNPFSSLTPEQLERLNNVPEFLKVTPELQKEIEEEQKKLRDRFDKFFIRPNIQESNLRFALEDEKMSREFFAAVDAGYVPSNEERNFNSRRLAQALQTQGRYAEALSTLVTGPAQDNDAEVARLTDEILEEINAIEIPDEIHCSCHTASDFPTTHIKKHVRVKGESLPLIQCTVCGHKNATKQLPDDLARLEKERTAPKKRR